MFFFSGGAVWSKEEEWDYGACRNCRLEGTSVVPVLKTGSARDRVAESLDTACKSPKPEHHRIAAPQKGWEMMKHLIQLLKLGIVGLASCLAVLVYKLIGMEPEERLIPVIYTYMGFAIVVLLIVGVFLLLSNRKRR